MMKAYRHIPIFSGLFLLVGCAVSHMEPPTPLTGRWHRVHENDTIASVSALYGTDAEAVSELNDLRDDKALATRESIFIPMRSGKAPGSAAPATATPADPDPNIAKPAVRQSPSEAVAGATGTERRSSTPKPEISCNTSHNPCLAWPLSGRIGTQFSTRGAKPHDGLDILTSQGTLIHAAETGEVLYSGAAIKGYGNLIIIRHKNNMLTVYAHNDKNLVTEGAHVDKGAVIAEAGRSGNADTVHLHFEVRVSETPKNPMEYLPSLPD